MGLVPCGVAGSALGVAAYSVNADTELHALAAAPLDETLVGLEEKRSWTWTGARGAHMAADDPDRSEAWEEILKGRHVLTARERWKDLSLSLDKELMAALAEGHPDLSSDSLGNACNDSTADGLKVVFTERSTTDVIASP